MKASELRIGVYVMLIKSGLYGMITGILKSSMHKSYTIETDCFGLNSLDSFEGIPLTEEWLLKFGFEDTSYADFIKKFNDHEYIRVSFKDYAHTTLACKPIEVSDFDLKLECKYVHQLQNLYFALTGEELTIK